MDLPRFYHVKVTDSPDSDVESGIYKRAPGHSKPLADEGLGTYGYLKKVAADVPDSPFHGSRAVKEGGKRGEYEWETYGVFLQRCNRAIEFCYDKLGAAMLEKESLGGYSIARVGVLMPNCPEWLIVDVACAALDVVLVPLYTTMGTEAMKHIANETRFKTLFIHESLLDKLEVFADCQLERVVVIAAVEGGKIKEKEQKSNVFQENKIPFPSRDEVIAELPSHIEARDRHEGRVNLICYTSGTTGSMPKGVVLREDNILNCCRVGLQTIPFGPMGALQVTQSDRHLSYLPLAHVYEYYVIKAFMITGAQVGFWSNSLDTLFEDVAALAPTLFVTVPRLLAKLHDKISETLSTKSALVRNAFMFALDRKVSSQQKTHWFWDRVFFAKIAKSFGGELRCIVSASAPLEGSMQKELSYILGVPIVQAWGMTETGGLGSLTAWNEEGAIGGMIQGFEVKLVAFDSYLPNNGEGEIYVRGPQVTEGYFLNPSATAEAITSDGWLKTGDIGRMDKDTGCLSIVDRAKNLLKLSQGEYVSPEKVEQILAKSRYVDQLFVDGKSDEAQLVAVVVENVKVKREMGEEPDQFLLAEFMRLGKEAKLMGFEIPRAIIWADEPFTVENGSLTPTAKVRRPIIRKQYEALIEDAYRVLNPQRSRLCSFD